MKKLNKITGEAVLISPLFALSIILNLWSECLLIIVLLFLYKAIYRENYHANKNIICVLISYSAVTFGLLVAHTFPKQYLLIILIYNVIAYASAKIGALQLKAKKYELIAEPYSELVEFYHEYKNKPFDVESCTEEELIERCRTKHFSEENIKLAIEFFINKTKHSTIANKLKIDEKSVTRRKMRMRDKLNS